MNKFVLKIGSFSETELRTDGGWRMADVGCLMSDIGSLISDV